MNPLLSAIPWAAWSACVEAEPPAPPDPLGVEREALREAERRVLSAEARAAMDAGDVAAAARVVAVEREAFPDDFEPLAEALLAAGDPAVVGILGGGSDEAAAVRRAFGRELVRTRERASGATVAQGRAIWVGVAREFVDDVDERAAAAAVVAAWGRMAADEGFVLAFDHHEVPAGERVGDLLSAAVAGGWPEDVTVVAGVDAALATLDPWTRPVWPSERARWEAHVAGVTLGIGVELAEAPGGGVVVAMPRVGGPAWRAGVHASDRVVSVDGVAPTSPADAAARIGGAPGTEVLLRLGRGDTEQRVWVKRAEVPDETVTGWRRSADSWDVAAAEGVAWVRIGAFRPDTDDAFDALTEFAAPDVVVIDLRGNGGGDLAAALHVGDRFVADGPLVHLVGRTLTPPSPGPDGELPWNEAAPGHALEGTPVVVLVDGGTASAAEVLAVILRERANAVILGEPSFGKLRSQGLRDDRKTGAAWQVTTGRWRVGDAVERVVPDLELPRTPAERRNVAELTLRRELPAVHPDGSPVVYGGEVARRDLPTLSEDPWVRWALAVAGGLAGR